MALYSSLDHDSRVLREASSLVDAGHDVTVYCLSWAGTADVPFRVVTHWPDRSQVLPDGSSSFHRGGPVGRVRRVTRLAGWITGYARNIRAWGSWLTEHAGAVDVWHAHDLPGLIAVGPRVGAGTALVYDSHEIFLEAGTATRLPGPVRRILAAYERRLVRRVDALVTVNEAYAGVLEKRLAPRRTVLVRNCPPRWKATVAGPPGLRASAGVPADAWLVLYHGALAADRGIEQSIAALAEPGMESAHLVLLGFGSVDRLGIEGSPSAVRVHRLEAVPPAELLSWVTEADVDVMPLQRSSLNHWLCTPNKLWESLAAGVPVVVSEFPVMRSIVMDDPSGPLGTVCDPSDPASLAKSIRSLLEVPSSDRAGLRARCRDAALERWNWETESVRLVELYRSLGGVSRTEPT
jgi:glycosyltransferase involved in cell wall biosynthesis